MNKLTSERGYVLIVVILIIAVIGIITPPIMSNILNSAIQYQSTEKELQLDKLRDMGLTFADEAILHSEDVALEETETWISGLSEAPSNQQVINQFETYFKDELSNLGINEELIIEIEEDASYRVSFEDISTSTSALTINYYVTPALEDDFDDRHMEEESKEISLSIN
ncbi:hypothetical protein [Halalkalibacillus halophilus]|uniref:hypothetical protein n=1 Tax=Halalkalibacillus halophilus TaxID=392827 RepID=UPI0004095489|nr:hypothetical protein [Halalkalibacillus halophilus]